jgi:hypothetical protein
MTEITIPKGWKIQLSRKPVPSKKFDYDYWHEDYDGSDGGNGLYGQAPSIKDAINQINEVVSVKKEPIKYHVPESCNACGADNDCTAVDYINSTMSECKTKCKSCGFEDYWAHGFFESSREMEGKCDTYSF